MEDSTRYYKYEWYIEEKGSMDLKTAKQACMIPVEQQRSYHLSIKNPTSTSPTTVSLYLVLCIISKKCRAACIAITLVTILLVVLLELV